MAHLQYNGVDLQIEKTASFDMQAVYDPSGMDFLYFKVRLAILCVWNPFATSSPLPVGARPPGNDLGQSLTDLRQTLMQPRGLLIYSIGPDRVFQVPTALAIVGVAPTTVPQCDPAGGPFPQYCRVLAIHADKTALVEYCIEFHVNDYMYLGKANYVLSHRWTVSSHIGEQWLTTRVTEGRATFRLDALDVLGAVPDQWRRNFSLYVPPGFIRKKIDVTATEDGRELVYRVEDRQCLLNLGATSQAVKVEINSTAGQEFPFHSAKDVWAGVQQTWRDSWDALGHAGRGDLLGYGMSIVAAANKLAPQNKANCIVRVYGQANADLATLTNLAVNIAIDRFQPPWALGALIPVSCYITQCLDTDGEGPVIELRAEYLPLNAAAVLAAFGGGAELLMNQSATILNQADGTVIASRTPGPNPPFPSDSYLASPANNATRGMWVAFLVSQALAAPGTVNAIPSADNNVPAPPGTPQRTLPAVSYDLT